MNFIKNLFGVSLRSKVMKAIAVKINQAQELYDSEVAAFKSAHSDKMFSLKDDFKDAVKELKSNKLEQLAAIEERHISNLLAKII